MYISEEIRDDELRARFASPTAPAQADFKVYYLYRAGEVVFKGPKSAFDLVAKPLRHGTVHDTSFDEAAYVGALQAHRGMLARLRHEFMLHLFEVNNLPDTHQTRKIFDYAQRQCFGGELYFARTEIMLTDIYRLFSE